MNEIITIVGNVGTDPEDRTTSAGLRITSFRVACTQRRLDRSSGQWVDAGTNWYDVSAFRRLAEHALASVRKGDPVVVSGRLRLRQWDNGTRQGMSADIEADVIGHDLRWGTSAFEKRSGEVREAATDGSEWATREPGAAGGATQPAPETDGWSAPAVLGEEPRPLALTSAETPF